MSTKAELGKNSREADWLPILETAVAEVFEIMLGAQVSPIAPPSQNTGSEEYTAMVGLAGALCGILTVECGIKAAPLIAKAMLGDSASSEAQVIDALGEICNMIAGNFKNKLAGTDENCVLSVPTVISGGEYNCHSMAEGSCLETVVLFEGCPVLICLQFND
jgi:chemotaxis protein CheX